MATFTIDMPPQLTGNDRDALQLRQYLVRLVDRLLYCLNHLDDENLVEGGISVGKIAGGGTAVIDSAGGIRDVSHLRAQVAEIVTAVIQTAVIDWANVDRLQAAVANIADAEIGTAKIDWAQIERLNAQTAIVARYVGEKMFIDRLGVTSAQMVDLTVGTLCLKGSDGKYYTIDVNPTTGTLTATETTVTQGEINAGVTQSGKHIIETDLTVQEMNASSVTAVEALISKLTAGRIDVDELFARQATITALTTGSIASALGASLELRSNSSIRAIVEGINQQLSELMVRDGSIEARVKQVENGIGTHVLINPTDVTIQQDHLSQYKAVITANRLSFVKRSDGSEAAGFGVEGGVVDRLRAIKSLSVGTEANGWYDMTSIATGVADKWRSGTGSALPPLITAEPTDQTANALGDSVTFHLTAENAADYQWWYRDTGTETWVSLGTGATGSTLTATLTAANLGREYRCVIGGIGTTEATSRAVRARIQGAPVIIAQPHSRSASAGTAITVRCAATGAAGYQWQHKNGSVWADITGETGSSYASTSGGTEVVRCVATGAGSTIAVTEQATLTWT